MSIPNTFAAGAQLLQGGSARRIRAAPRRCGFGSRANGRAVPFRVTWLTPDPEPLIQ